jgi:hypothetical protein
VVFPQTNKYMNKKNQQTPGQNTWDRALLEKVVKKITEDK